MLRKGHYELTNLIALNHITLIVFTSTLLFTYKSIPLVSITRAQQNKL